ncbi:MAG: beta-galactosidase [Ruminococcaceae bacterium]|nr:beta-galactosidase [Oscillospiraceae bacterium]
MSIPRPEYPRPQFVRDSFINLNGEWQFGMDADLDGIPAPQDPAVTLPRTITVPFCPESVLSGIGHTDFIQNVWYRRTFTRPATDGRVLLHFGAVDYLATVYMNGQKAGTHRGGYTPFTLDITGLLRDGENDLAVHAFDDTLDGLQASGKQSVWPQSRGCHYTRTTGIWQTVWMECVPSVYLKRVKTQTDYHSGTVTFESLIEGGDPAGKTLRTTVYADGAAVVSHTQEAARNNAFAVTVPNVRLWDVNDPYLYDVVYELSDEDGNVVDRVTSYVGVRGVEVKNNAMYLNGRAVFQRLVLDQGFYPDGIYTAPTDDALRQDIVLSQELGFNGARLHQKVFEERYLYHADKLGYLVWDEYGNWGVDYGNPLAIHPYLQEWLEVVERDYNHPALIGWCPFNEAEMAGGKPVTYPDLLRTVYLATKAVDATRPAIDVSGYYHVHPTDVYDVHDYDQNPETFRARYADLAIGSEVMDPYHGHSQEYRGGAFFVSEYGGARYSSAEADVAWGYGEAPADEVAFMDRYVGLTEALLQNPKVCALCYTQIYDVEQEQNGLYTYARERKFTDAGYARIRACNTQVAAIEKEK